MDDALFQGHVNTEFKSINLAADVLLEVMLKEQKALLHIEFQSTRDDRMAQRLLEYNILATCQHQKHVLSCVIYLRRESATPQAPLIWSLPDGRTILSFDFFVIKL